MDYGEQAIPGYRTIKEAAEKLGLAPNTVYEYVDEGRLPHKRAGNLIMIPDEALDNFKRNVAGRPRKNVPPWRRPPDDNRLFVTLITVQLRKGQLNRFVARLEDIRREGLHLFPGTITRFIASSDTISGQIIISLTWRGSVMPDESGREQALEELRHALADVLDWSTAQYSWNNVLLHG